MYCPWRANLLVNNLHNNGHAPPHRKLVKNRWIARWRKTFIYHTSIICIWETKLYVYMYICIDAVLLLLEYIYTLRCRAPFSFAWLVNLERVLLFRTLWMQWKNMLKIMVTLYFLFQNILYKYRIENLTVKCKITLCLYIMWYNIPYVQIFK